MRGNRIYDAFGWSVGLHRALSFHQLPAAGRDLENRVNLAIGRELPMDPALEQGIFLLRNEVNQEWLTKHARAEDEKP